jgi:hypothetical protein
MVARVGAGAWLAGCCASGDTASTATENTALQVAAVARRMTHQSLHQILIAIKSSF